MSPVLFAFYLYEGFGLLGMVWLVSQARRGLLGTQGLRNIEIILAYPQTVFRLIALSLVTGVVQFGLAAILEYGHWKRFQKPRS